MLGCVCMVFSHWRVPIFSTSVMDSHLVASPATLRLFKGIREKRGSGLLTIGGYEPD